MGQNLFLRFPIEVTVALLTMIPMLVAVTRALIALRKVAPVRMPGHPDEAPCPRQARDALLPGQLDVVPQAGREPANR